MTETPPSPRSWPVRGWIGLVLLLGFWSLNWSLEGLRTHWAFFGLWLGYCLLVDAGVWLRSGTSLWARSRQGYVQLFLASIPIWWLFELINRWTDNWVYLGRDMFSDLEYVLLGSLSFSTVVPAVLGTAELVSTAGWLQRVRRGWRLPASPRLCWGLVVAGLASSGLMLIWPRYFFPLVWVSLFLLVDPLNFMNRRPAVTGYLAAGEWRGVLALGAGCLVCGFFWEMWNYWSYPKWTYSIPYGDFLRVFEMPILGYGGYLPFSLEIFALYHLIAGVTGLRWQDGYIRVVQPEGEGGPSWPALGGYRSRSRIALARRTRSMNSSR